MSTAAIGSLGSMPEVKSLFSRALSALLADVPAERAVICYGERQDRDLKPRIAYGMRMQNFWTDAPVSLSVLRKCRQEGSPVLEGAISADAEGVLSVVLSGAKSLLCVPFWGPGAQDVCGLVYCDTTSPYKAFTRDHFNRAVKLARQLEEQLALVRKGLPPRAATAAVRPAPVVRAAAPKAVSKEEPKSVLKTPSCLAQAIFFRSLSTLFAAGIPLARALSILSTQSEDARMAAVAEGLHRQVVMGQALSKAMENTRVFTSFQVRMVAVAERTGRLGGVLEHVADYQEVVQRDRVRLRSALAYPALVLTGCLITLFVLPGFLMSGQFQLLRELKVPLPWLTRCVSALAHPAGVVALLALAGVGLALLKRSWRRLPLVRNILRCQALSQFALALSMQLDAGVLPHDGMLEAAATTEHPELERAAALAAGQLVEGETLRDSLAASEFFPRVFLEMVEVGEESGQVADILMWLSRMYQEELEATLGTLAAMLEPLVMLVLGVIAGVVMLATMLPMVRALEAL